MHIPTFNENTNSQASGISTTISLKWRAITRTTYYPAGDVRVSQSVSGIFSPNSPRPGEERSIEGTWNVGGTAEPANRVCQYTVGSLADAVFLYKTPNKPDGTYYYAYFDWNVLTKTVIEIEIDWEDFADKLRTAKPLNQNLSVIGMGGTPSGGNPMDFIQSGIVSGQFLTNLYRNNDDTNVQPILPNIEPTTWGKPNNLDIAGALPEDAKPNYDEVNGGTPSKYPTENETWSSSQCQGFKTSIPMTVKIYLGNKDDDYKKPEESLIANKDYFVPNFGDVGNVGNWDNATGFTGESISSNVGSTSGSGLNLVEILNGNSLFPFDSVYFTAGDYTNFVSGGGGLVGESGIFPNSDTIWIEDIDLNVQGNSMTVFQNTYFDATPLLTVGERIFGYIINQSGDYQPSFAGWVTSAKKVLDGNAERIQYSCNCLQYYLDQICTPSFYKYVPSKTNPSSNLNIEYIIKKMLVRAGITMGDIDIASINAPDVTWNFESINNVLNWGQNFLGKYVYYIDKNGLLNFKATDSGSFIKNFEIPTRGNSITASNNVLQFSPLTDFSRSRSKIILVGDFPLTELSGERTFIYPYGTDPSDYTNPVDANTTGIYQFKNEQGFTYYYLMWKSSKTIVNELISDPSKGVEFIKVRDNYSEARGGYRTTDRGITLEISQLSTEVGNSFVYMWRKVAPAWNIYQQGRYTIVVVDPYSTDISYRYVVKEDEPLSVSVNTGYQGGTEVIKLNEFKKVTSDSYSSDDTPLMQEYLNTIKDFYVPIYGGNLVIDGLDTDMELLGKVSITNTDLPAIEANELFIYGIKYDCVSKKTSLELSNKTYITLPYFSKQELLTLNKSRDKKAMTDIALDTLWNVPRA